MSWRSNTVDTTGGGWITSRYAGLGVPSADIPATGDSGAGYLYNDFVANGAGEYRGVILTLPSAGSFTTYETSAFSFTDAPDGVYTATYRGYKDGVTYGDFTITMTIGGGGTVYTSGGESAVSFSGAGDDVVIFGAGGQSAFSFGSAGGAHVVAITSGQSLLSLVAVGDTSGSSTSAAGVIRLPAVSVKTIIRADNMNILGLFQGGAYILEIPVTIDGSAISSAQALQMDIYSGSTLQHSETICTGITVSGGVVSIPLATSETVNLAGSYNYELWYMPSGSTGKHVITIGTINFIRTNSRIQVCQ